MMLKHRERTWVLVLASVVVLSPSLACASRQVGPFEQVARIEDERLDEISGIVASRRHLGHYYVHNDSGDQPRVFLIDRQGKTRAVIRLKDAIARDWEDIAIAPRLPQRDGASAATESAVKPTPKRDLDTPKQTRAAEQRVDPGWDIVVADIGDNNHLRPVLTLYRFAEPELPEQFGALITVTPTRYTIRYAGGAVDAEGIVVEPRSGDAYIFSKRRDGKPSDVFKLAAPWPTDREAVLPRVATLELPGSSAFERFITAADLAPNGRQLTLRGYLRAWQLTLPADAPAGDMPTLLKQPPSVIYLAPEPKGEAICYAPDGKHLLTASEETPTYLFEHPVE